MGDTAKGLIQGIFLGPAGDPNVNPGAKSWFKKSGTPGKGADKALADAALELLSASRDTRNTFFSQLSEALTTGKVDARLPEVQAAVEGSLQSGSNDKRQLSEALAVNNLGRTPFGQQQLASQALASKQKVATTPADVINSLLLQAPNASLSQTQATGLSGLGTLAGISTNQRIANLTNQANVYQQVGAGVGGLAATGGTAYADYAGRQQFAKLYGGGV